MPHYFSARILWLFVRSVVRCALANFSGGNSLVQVLVKSARIIATRFYGPHRQNIHIGEWEREKEEEEEQEKYQKPAEILIIEM